MLVQADTQIRAYKFIRLLFCAGPLRLLRMRHTEMVENAKHKVIDQLFDCLWPVIKTWTGGNDARTRLRQPRHVLQMYLVVWRFARHDYEPPTLFQSGVSSS